ncbi:MAG: GNAT family N-acetyltransferase [Flavisolibacter sp.]
MGAQLYLEKFYESFGFQRVSDVYLEDGIEHIYMIRQ